MSRRGVRTFDLRRLHAVLRGALSTLLRDNALGAAARVATATAEAQALLQHASAANVVAELAAALLAALSAWRTLLGVALADCYALLRAARRESLVLELLERLVAALASPATSPALAPLLASAVLAIVTKLRETHGDAALAGVQLAKPTTTTTTTTGTTAGAKVSATRDRGTATFGVDSALDLAANSSGDVDSVDLPVRLNRGFSPVR